MREENLGTQAGVLLHVIRSPLDTDFTVYLIAILKVTSPIVINVPTRGLLAVETKGFFCSVVGKI